MSQQDIRFQPQYCSYAHLAALTPDACFLAGAGCQQKHQSKCHEKCYINQKRQQLYLLDLQMPGCREAHLLELLACLHCLQHTAPDLHTNTVSIIAMLCCQQPCRVQAVVYFNTTASLAVVHWNAMGSKVMLLPDKLPDSCRCWFKGVWKSSGLFDMSDCGG